MSHRVIYIMGVSGSGKTTVGQLLSAKTGYAFFDADDFHPQKNIDKMKAGQPLTDDDRSPWLDHLHAFVKEKINEESIIMACSALKQSYRDRLSDGIEEHCRWVFLNGTYETIHNRLKDRADHYMPESLLQSQFDALERPANTIDVDIRKSPQAITDLIISQI